MHHCNSLKIKPKLGAVIDSNVRFARDILPILVIFSLFSLTQNRHEAKLHRCKTVNDLNAPFHLKQCTRRFGYSRSLLAI